ncbi:uncharacterized protein LOC129908261 isoform X1 [Episyrphus balteatus]|uniref:uncharacterized protein LOC129908261 isoform X1 n=2 Tax=Episyrphus balteatus TaxID=286459 RepID=UPI00248658EF|nr:uncharacterized protein LOC129908261 isoform X1 [Episyrphus balteatus]
MLLITFYFEICFYFVVIKIRLLLVTVNVDAFCNMVNIKWFPAALGSLAPALIPPGHIAVLWYFWDKFNLTVDKQVCSCSCWDTVFKGPYESGIASYKHMYFNATQNSTKMWILTVMAVIGLYECIKQLISLTIQKHVRYSMMLLFALSIFSHYYAWWMCINYYNDDYYRQWNHQMFFTITELISTVMIVHLANIHNQVTSKKVLCVIGIALLHIVTSSFDQFITNVIRGEGFAHQVIRDIGFMVPDLLQVILPLWLFQKTRRESYRSLYHDRILQKDIIAMCVIVFLLFIFCSML